MKKQKSFMTLSILSVFAILMSSSLLIAVENIVCDSGKILSCDTDDVVKEFPPGSGNMVKFCFNLAKTKANCECIRSTEACNQANPKTNGEEVFDILEDSFGFGVIELIKGEIIETESGISLWNLIWS